ncbi:MAG: hypothetical protein KA154_16140 [Gemmatimonadaceae bacterium]|nr:hypothetical protein [Gemmatimonadaceae bacterium]MCC6431020.1 hypothetical protein [Gemmatimonadaceae bacterium]
MNPPASGFRTSMSRAVTVTAAFLVLSAPSGCARWAPTPSAGLDVRTEGAALTGRKLERPFLDDATRERLTAQLNAAADTLKRMPNSPDALIWVGRRLAYLGKYREAIDTFSAGAARFPRDARFLRHRGHRWLTVRRPMLAAQDLAKAATLVRGQADVIEPDGAPNAQNIPLSTLQFNIWYHLALAHYVDGRFPEALAAWDSCARVSVNPDLQVATQYWRYLVLARMGNKVGADSALAIARANPPLIENMAYLRLLRLYAGLESVESVYPGVATANVSDATTAYGVSMWHVLNGRRDEARALWKQLDASPAWASFGVLAAEAELTRR